MFWARKQLQQEKYKKNLLFTSYNYGCHIAVFSPAPLANTNISKHTQNEDLQNLENTRICQDVGFTGIVNQVPNLYFF